MNNNIISVHVHVNVIFAKPLFSIWQRKQTSKTKQNEKQKQKPTCLTDGRTSRQGRLVGRDFFFFTDFGQKTADFTRFWQNGKKWVGRSCKTGFFFSLSFVVLLLSVEQSIIAMDTVQSTPFDQSCTPP